MIGISTLRQASLLTAVLAAVSLAFWVQHERTAQAQMLMQQAKERAVIAHQNAERERQTSAALRNALNHERQAQSALRDQQDQLKQQLVSRHQQIKELKRDNQALQHWAAQPLPDLARRLRERPALTGADAYRQWLPGRGALSVAGDASTQ